ncbi:MAG: hypothetical protein ACK58L_10375 [Planctomycetota bacterium]
MKRASSIRLYACGIHARRGAISVMAVVVLVIVSLLVSQYVRRALNDRRYTRSEAERLQAESLADAGLQWAQTSLGADGSWPGTTWELPKGTISQTKTGRVTISVKNGTCTVIARYPADSTTPVQVTRFVDVSELTKQQTKL